MRSFKLSLATFAALAFGLTLGVAPAFARPVSSVPTRQYTHKKMPEQASQTKKTFIGTVVKSKNGKCYLDANGHSYWLSDQSKAEKYVGKEVKVTGTLDTRTRTIHVSSIKLGHNPGA